MDVCEFSDLLYGQGKADRTVNEYTKWVGRLARWAAPADLPSLPAHQVRRWCDDTVPHTWASRKQARTSLAHYYRAVGRTDEPWEAVRVPRKPRQKPRPLPADQARRLRDGAILYGGRPGLATLSIMYTAMRPGETAGLRWDGIDLDAATIRWWRPKTSEWHQVPLHPTLADALSRAWPTHVEGWVFSGDRGRPHVSGTTVWGWVRKVGDAVGVDVTPRALRSTAGCMALEATGDLDAAAELLGHRDVSVTRLHYTVTSEQRLSAAVLALDY